MFTLLDFTGTRLWWNELNWLLGLAEKTVQRNTAVQTRTCSTYQNGPKRKQDFLVIDNQLTGKECNEAISFLRHSNDVAVVKEKMRATFQYQQTLVQDERVSSIVLDVFLSFLDATDLVRKINIYIFSCIAISKWNFHSLKTFSLLRRVWKFKMLEQGCTGFIDVIVFDIYFPPPNLHLGWDSDLLSILLLVHLLPPPQKATRRVLKSVHIELSIGLWDIWVYAMF